MEGEEGHWEEAGDHWEGEGAVSSGVEREGEVQTRHQRD